MSRGPKFNVGDLVELKPGRAGHCPDGRVDNKQARVQVVLGDLSRGELRMDRDLNGCLYWNAEELVHASADPLKERLWGQLVARPEFAACFSSKVHARKNAMKAIKQRLWHDGELWDGLLYRHGLASREFSAMSPPVQQHILDNFIATVVWASGSRFLQ